MSGRLGLENNEKYYERLLARIEGFDYDLKELNTRYKGVISVPAKENLVLLKSIREDLRELDTWASLLEMERISADGIEENRRYEDFVKGVDALRKTLNSEIKWLRGLGI